MKLWDGKHKLPTSEWILLRQKNVSSAYLDNHDSSSHCLDRGDAAKDPLTGHFDDQML